MGNNASKQVTRTLSNSSASSSSGVPVTNSPQPGVGRFIRDLLGLEGSRNNWKTFFSQYSGCR